MYVGKDGVGRVFQMPTRPRVWQVTHTHVHCLLPPSLLPSSHSHIHNNLSSHTSSWQSYLTLSPKSSLVIPHTSSMLAITRMIKWKRFQWGAYPWTPGEASIGWDPSLSILSLSHSWLGGVVERVTGPRDSSMVVAQHTGCYQSKGGPGFPMSQRGDIYGDKGPWVIRNGASSLFELRYSSTLDTLEGGQGPNLPHSFLSR